MDGLSVLPTFMLDLVHSEASAASFCHWKSYWVNVNARRSKSQFPVPGVEVILTTSDLCGGRMTSIQQLLNYLVNV